MKIKPIKSYSALDIYTEGDRYEMCHVKPVRELEANYRELLEAFFIEVKTTADFIESVPNITFMDDAIARHISNIELIKKAIGEKWSDLR